MAVLYAKIAGGNWSSPNTWSATSSAGVDNAGPPAASSDVIFETASGNVTIDANSVCRSLDMTSGTGNYAGTLTWTSGFTLNIGDGTAGAGNVALKFVSGRLSGISSSTQVLSFVSTSTTEQTINFATNQHGPLTFNGAGGKWKLMDASAMPGGWNTTLTAGSLDINGQTCSWGSLLYSGGTTRSLTSGNASITIFGTGGLVFGLTDGTGLTINLTGSTITFTGASPTARFSSVVTYPNVIFNCSGTAIINDFSSGTTFTNLTYNGSTNKTGILSIGSNFTVTGVLTLAGNSATNRVLIQSNTVGTARTITNTGATMTISNCDFQDITVSTAWDASAQTDIGNCGGNSGITFPASVSQYYGGVNLNGSYLRCNGIASNYVSAPDSAALSITGDMTIDVKVAMDDWTPSSTKNIVSKWTASGAQRSYQLNLQTDGKLQFANSNDGTATVISTSSAATGVSDGSVKWIRVTVDVDNGASGNDVKFYTSDDGSSWSQLGTTVTNVGTTTIYDSTAIFEIGSITTGTASNLIGNIYRTRAYSDITQTTKVFDADFTAQSAGTKSFTESSANAATVSLVVTGGNWSASSWTTRVPLPQDDAYLGNAYAASQTVTADMPRLGRSIDWTGATGTPAWARSTAQSIFGGLTLISGMTLSGTVAFTFAGRSSFSITSSGKTTTNQIQINAPNGTYTLADSLVIDRDTTSAFVLNNGTFTDSGYSVTLTGASGTVTVATGTLNATGIWSIGATAVVNLLLISGGTVNASTSTIVITSASSNTRIFAGGGKVFGTFTYTVVGSTGKLTITGSNSFSVINFSDASNARTLEFTAATTTTIRSGNGFNVQGTSGKLMTVTSATAAQHTLASTSRQVCSYLNVSQSAASAGLFYAQTTSTDGGSNSGWIFTDAPAVATGSSVSGRNLQNLQNITNL